MLNRTKTHCLLGHALEGENMFINSNGFRICRICHRARKLKSYLARKGRKNIPVLAETLAQKLERNIFPVPESGCWLWDSTVSQYGYGTLKFEGRKQLAHRLSYIHFKGQIQDGMMVCHKCDTPLCVNPDHLFLGVALDNHLDMVKKGRGAWQKRAALESALGSGEKS